MGHIGGVPCDMGGRSNPQHHLERDSATDGLIRVNEIDRRRWLPRTHEARLSGVPAGAVRSHDADRPASASASAPTPSSVASTWERMSSRRGGARAARTSCRGRTVVARSATRPGRTRGRTSRGSGSCGWSGWDRRRAPHRALSRYPVAPVVMAIRVWGLSRSVHSRLRASACPSPRRRRC